MSEILFLAHRIPFPPDRGDKIRSHHILKALARLAPVHVACFMDDAADAAEEASLAALAASHCLVGRTKPVPLAALEAVATGKPVSIPAFASSRIARYVAETLRSRPISTLFVFSVQMAQYVPADFAGRVVMDFVDVDSAKFEAYAAKSAQPLRTLYAREARLLARFEETIARRAHVSLLVTPEEAALFASRIDQRDPPRIEALGNGIDAAFFDPAGRSAAPEMLAGGPQIVFTGQMDYPPNVEAVEFFAREVMPAILAVHPASQFQIVGREPAAAVLALDGVNGARVRGRVPDVRPWLAGADLVVAPLLTARGVQNKVLEAMAMARPVLCTSAAATGIAARNGSEFSVADGADALAQAALALLSDTAASAAMGGAARQFVISRCGWDAVLAGLPALAGFERRERRDAA
jgi:sugar transferase (PEP-CTERM/EpsH1 system associated)